LRTFSIVHSNASLLVHLNIIWFYIYLKNQIVFREM
jgi:hypothetical protein